MLAKQRQCRVKRRAACTDRDTGQCARDHQPVEYLLAVPTKPVGTLRGRVALDGGAARDVGRGGNHFGDRRSRYGGLGHCGWRVSEWDAGRGGGPVPDRDRAVHPEHKPHPVDLALGEDGLAAVAGVRPCVLSRSEPEHAAAGAGGNKKKTGNIPPQSAINTDGCPHKEDALHTDNQHRAGIAAVATVPMVPTAGDRAGLVGTDEAI